MNADDVRFLAQVLALQAEVLGVAAQVVGMQAENAVRAHRGEAPAYDEAAFVPLAERTYAVSEQLWKL